MADHHDTYGSGHPIGVAVLSSRTHLAHVAEVQARLLVHGQTTGASTTDAGVIPAVLGAKSTVLDLGRKARSHTEAQRLVIAMEQQHWQHPLCNVAAWLCHVHRTTPWSPGGPTNTDQAQLLCPRHHSLAHQGPPDPPSRT